MGKGNVLVIGNSGVGKSTLINAVLGENVAKTNWGEKGTTEELTIYNGELFNVIDTVGFEPSLLRNNKAINAVKKWSKISAKGGNEDTEINVIWFCIDGTSSKLFPKTIRDLSKAISIWKTVPIITVITKSYSVPDRATNIALVNNVFDKNKDLSARLRGIMPVVASTYVLNDIASAPPEGITELIERTCNVMPEGKRNAKKDIAKFNLARKRALSQGSILMYTGAAAAKCAIPSKTPDAVVLSLIEKAMVDTLGMTYGVDKNSTVAKFMKGKIDDGTVNVIAKKILTVIDNIPVVKDTLGAIINPLIASCVVIIIGEVVAVSFEKVYLGEDEKEISVVFDKFLNTELIKKSEEIINKVSKTLTKDSSPKDIADAVTNAYNEENQ